jgi:hypothetical protein
MWQQLRRAIRLRQFLAGFSGLALGLLANVASDYMAVSAPWLISIVVLVFVATLLASIFLDVRGPARVGLILQPVKTLRTDAEKQAAARRGLIAFVSLYRPFRGSRVPSTQASDWLAAAERGDYDDLDLPNSNLAPAIEAVVTHASKLEHCWLIGTTSADAKQPGSVAYIPILETYLQQEGNVKCQFHSGPEWQLPLDDDALVFSKTLELVRKAFAEAKELKLAAEDLVADFTGGVRGMTLGMILGCLDSDRDIEMIGAHYGPDGTPMPPLFPAIFGFEPVLRER